LILAAEEALKPTSRAYVRIVDAIREDHIRASKEVIGDAVVLESLEAEIEEECTRLANFLGAAQIIDEITPKTKDAIIGTGEKLSCMFMAALLKDRVCSGFQVVGGWEMNADGEFSGIGYRCRICRPRKHRYHNIQLQGRIESGLLRHAVDEPGGEDRAVWGQATGCHWILRSGAGKLAYLYRPGLH